MDHYDEERIQLAEDDEKLRIALEEARNDDWFDYDDDDEDEEDEDQLLIDLEAPSDLTAQSTSSGYVESGPRSQYMTIDEDSQDRRAIPPGIALPPSLGDIGSSAVEKTLALNRALQLILESRVESIEAALEFNKEKQERLNDGAWTEMENKKAGKGRTWGPFRAPYFQSYGVTAYPPDNEDTIVKRQSNELPYHSLSEAKSYNKITKHNLTLAIIEDTRERLMKPIMNRLEVEVKKATELRNVFDEHADDVEIERKKLKALKQSQSVLKERKPVDEVTLEENEREIEDCKHDLEKAKEGLGKRLKLKMDQDEKVDEIEFELKMIREDSDEAILGKVDSSKVDWMKLSKMWFKGVTSWLDCQKEWDFIVNPKINLKPWTSDEEGNLLYQVEDLDNRDWQNIALAIGTGRTPFHCFYHYQNRFNNELKSRMWTKEEDLKLLDAVKKVRGTASLFTWRKVAALVNSRSSYECSARYSHIGDEKKFGRWDREEDTRLITAVNTMGMNWRKVAKFMGKRTSTQCKERYTQCLSPDINFFHFTYDEDKKLLRLIKEHGFRWVHLSRFLKGRTDTMLKNRWTTLQKWRMEMDWWNNVSESDKNLLLGKNLSINQRKLLEGQGKLFYMHKLGVISEDYERRQMDSNNGVDPQLIPPRPPMHFKYHRFQKAFSTKRHGLWSKRLSLHHQLLETLKKRYEEGHKKVGAAGGGKGKKKVFYTAPENDNALSEEDEQLKEVMDKTVQETASHNFVIPKKKMQEMMSTLNLHFLGGSKVHVTQILKSSHMESVNRCRAAQHHRKRVNLRVRSVLARNKWIFMTGMARRHHILPADGRRPEEIELQTQNCKNKLPGTLFRKLGGDSVTLMQNIKEKCVKAKEQKKKWLSFKEDSQFKIKMKIAQRKLSEVQGLRHLSKEQREKFIGKCKRKMATLKKDYSKAYALRNEMLDGALEECEVDTKFLQDVEKNGHILDNVFEESSKLLFTSGVPLSFEASQPSTSGIEKECHSSLPYNAEGQKETDKEPDVIYKSLDFIPPNLSTMSALRSLLLQRQKLMKTAGNLYKPSRYKRKKKQHLHIIIDSDDTAGQGVKDKKDDRPPKVKAIQVVEEEEEGTFTGSWFKTEGDEGHEKIVDKELKETGNLPSTSFAPYGVHKPIPNPRFKSRVKGNAEFYATASSTTSQVTMDMTRLNQDVSSGYQILYGPSVNNLDKVLRKNPGLDTIPLERIANSKSKPIEKCVNPQIPDVCSTQSSQTTLAHRSQEQGKKGMVHTAQSHRNDRTIHTSQEQKKNQTAHKAQEQGKERTTQEKRTNQNNTGNKDSCIMNSHGMESTDKSAASTDTLGDNEDADSLIIHVNSPNSSVENSDDGSRSSYPEKVSAAEGAIDPSDETEGKERVFHTIRHLKSVKDLRNVVVVGVNLESKKVVHYNADEFKQKHTTSAKKDNPGQNITQSVKSFEPRSHADDSSSQDASDTHSISTATSRISETTLAEKSVLNEKDDDILSVSCSSTGIENVPGNDGSETVLSTMNKNSQTGSGNETARSNARLANDNENALGTHNPQETINRLMKSSCDGEQLKNVVVVGLDPNSGEVVHFKSGSDSLVTNTYKTSEHRQSVISRETQVAPIPQASIVSPEDMTDQEVLACMTKVRQTEEYKRLLARFRALFLWPVLMSTLHPKDEVQLLNATELQDPDNAEVIQKKEVKTPIKRPRGRPMKTIGKKQSAVVQHVKTRSADETKRKPRKDYSVILPKSDRPRRKINNKQSYVLPKCKVHKARVNELPDWWKDAVVGVMVTRKAINEGWIDSNEVDISQDEDFVDKGNYSDDEWLVELRQEEERKKEQWMWMGKEERVVDDNDEEEDEADTGKDGNERIEESNVEEMEAEDGEKSINEECVVLGDGGEKSINEECVVLGDDGDKSINEECVVLDNDGDKSINEECVVLDNDDGDKSINEECVVLDDDGEKSINEECVVLDDDDGDKSINGERVVLDNDDDDEERGDAAVSDDERTPSKKRRGIDEDDDDDKPKSKRKK